MLRPAIETGNSVLDTAEGRSPLWPGMDGGHCIDAGSFLIGKELARIEGKLDAVLQRQAALARVGARIFARVEQIAAALEIDREAGSMTLTGEPPRQETP